MTTIFQLRRKGRINLLAMWLRLHPERENQPVDLRAGFTAAMTTDQIAAEVWDAVRERR